MIDLYYERSFLVPESSKRKSQQQSKEKLTKEDHYTVIIDNNKKGGSDLSAQIILLNQRIQKILSVITMEKKFLNSIQKFTSL